MQSPASIGNDRRTNIARERITLRSTTSHEVLPFSFDYDSNRILLVVKYFVHSVGVVFMYKYIFVKWCSFS